MSGAFSGRRLAVLVLCAMSALLEGFDISSMGVAAPKLVPAFGLGKGEAGWIFSAATLGLFFGAMFGGRAADLIGRKRALIVSLLMFGLCSWITPHTTGFATLFAARFLTGLGLGGAMPNFITLASEIAPPERRLSVVTIVMAALPFGGALAAVVALVDGFGLGWQGIFYVGGVLPILIAAGVVMAIPNDIPASKASELAATEAKPPVLTTLFGGQQLTTTLLLWVSFFFTQIVLLLLLNWLPSLMNMVGFSNSQASIIQIGFNIAGGLASLYLGKLQEGQYRRWWVFISYAGMGLALVAVGAISGNFWVALVAGAIAGGFVVSAQLVLFALAPLYYPTAVRGTGVGAAVAAGRLGSVVGPLFAGALLAAGGSTASVIFAIQPFVIIAGVAALALTWRKRLGQ